MVELPPILHGSAEEQLRQLRDYLVRIVSESSDQASVVVVKSKTTGSNYSQAIVQKVTSQEKNISEVRAYAERLKSMIVKNAAETQQRLSEFDGRIDGIDGLFFYIRYAPVPEPTAEQMTTEPQDDTAYMGVCSTNEETAPTDPATYTWSRILGKSSLFLQIWSSNGNIFKSGNVSTTLNVRVWSGEEDVTDLFDDNDFCWTRVSSDAEGDRSWNSAHFGGTKQITVSSQDVWGRATFFCELRD